MATQSNNIIISVPTGPSEWTAMEHYRLHTVETWAASPYKDATLAAIHSSLAGLLLDATMVRLPECSICWSRNNARTVVELPSRPRLSVRPRLAA